MSEDTWLEILAGIALMFFVVFGIPALFHLR